MRRRPSKKAAKLRSFARWAAICLTLASVVLLLTWSHVRNVALRTFIRIGRGEEGFLQQTISGEGVFAGGAAIVKAPSAGIVHYLVHDKEPVRAGQAVAHIIQGEAATAFAESLTFAQTELSSFEEATEYEFHGLLSHLQSVYEETVALAFRVRKAHATGDLREAKKAEQSLLEAEGILREGRSRLLSIENARSALASNVQSIIFASEAAVVEILSPDSGVFSLDATPFDASLSKERLLTEDAAGLISLYREATTAGSADTKQGRAVQSGEIIGRVISGRNLSFFVPLKTEEALNLKVGRRVGLSVNSTVLSDDAEITHIIDGMPPGYSVVAGEVSLAPPDLVVRAGGVSLLLASKSGVIVPRSAILEQDGKVGVLTVQKTYARFVPVEVLLQEGDKVVLQGITVADEIVMRARGFLEGKRVR